MDEKRELSGRGERPWTRRHFLKGTAALAGLALVTPASRVWGANERFRVAVCGVRGRGNYLMRQFAGLENVEVAWIIDPDRRQLERRSEEMGERTGRTPQTSADVRRALEDPTVDALVVGAPNHWHSLMVIWAAQAGKHCYVEKPASHHLYEGRVALAAARRYGVVVQHGTQRRSSQAIADLVKAIHSGKYGKLAVAQGVAMRRRTGIGHQPVTAPPEWLDWNLWRGPAAIDEFHANLVHYNWHWFWATGNGEVNNQGTHQLDVAYWALDPEMHDRHPVRVTALGGRFGWDDQAEVPNTFFGMAEYPNGQKVVMVTGNGDYENFQQVVENRFYFEDGGRIVPVTHLTPEGERSVRIEYVSPSGESAPVEGDHAAITPGGEIGSFVRACRAGRPEMANGDMRDAHYSCALGHLMNAAYRIGRPAPFEARAARFGDDSRVGELFLEFHQAAQAGWQLPEEGSSCLAGPLLEFDSEREQFTGEHAAEANLFLREPRRGEFDIPAPDRV